MTNTGEGDLDELLREAVAVVDGTAPPTNEAEAEPPEDEKGRLVKLKFEEALDEAVSEEIEGIETDSPLVALEAENEKLREQLAAMNSGAPGMPGAPAPGGNRSQRRNKKVPKRKQKKRR